MKKQYLKDRIDILQKTNKKNLQDNFNKVFFMFINYLKKSLV